jgi:hypothetical protein
MMRLLATSILTLIACGSAEGDPTAPLARDPSRPEGPLVIELFTSQGCSSCPPADRLLSKLAAGDPRLAPLSFHVDYWNDLGWPDPYSAPSWTERQRQYSVALGDNRVYTPELVVGGATGMVGSSAGVVAQAITAAARPALLPATAKWADGQVDIAATAPAGADVWVAVWEDGTQTKVTRGENAGETLGSDRVVRRFERVATAGNHGAVTVKLDPTWKNLGAVAFAQRADRHIVATALLPR